MKLFGILLAISFLAGCTATPVSSETKGNNIQVETLFVDSQGCRLSRFYDDGNYHYYANCPKGSTSTSSIKGSGKFSQQETIQTSN